MTPANAPIQDLPGVSASQANGLAQLGLTTIEQLYRYGQSPVHRQTLAQTLAVPERYIKKWVILAELARLPSVGCTYSGLLLHAGIISVSQLADSTAPMLYTRIQRLHVKTMQRTNLCPSADQVSTWIQQAKQMQAQMRRT